MSVLDLQNKTLEKGRQFIVKGTWKNHGIIPKVFSLQLYHIFFYAYSK